MISNLAYNILTIRFLLFCLVTIVHVIRWTTGRRGLGKLDCHHVIMSSSDYCTTLQRTWWLKGHRDNTLKHWGQSAIPITTLHTHHHWPGLTFSAETKKEFQSKNCHINTLAVLLSTNSLFSDDNVSPPAECSPGPETERCSSSESQRRPR